MLLEVWGKQLRIVINWSTVRGTQERVEIFKENNLSIKIIKSLLIIFPYIWSTMTNSSYHIVPLGTKWNPYY